jgi:hypothetical protein
VTEGQRNRRLSEIARKPTFRMIDGLSIRFAESGPGPQTLYCSVRGPRAYLRTNPRGRGWQRRHIWLRLTCQDLAAPSEKTR